MSNQFSRRVVFVLAATMLHGCAEPQEDPIEQDGLTILHSTSSSLRGRFAQHGQRLSFDITRDAECHTLNLQRADGESLVRMALCRTGDAVDIGSVLRAEGPAGSLLAGIPLNPVNATLDSPEVARLLADPAFAMLGDLNAELAQQLHVDPSIRLPADLAQLQAAPISNSVGGDVCRATCGTIGAGCLVLAALAPFPANLIAAAVCIATTIGCEAACPR